MTAPDRGGRWRWAGLLLARLLMDAALIDAGVETWLSGSPARWWVVAPIALYILLSGWALAQGSRLAAPGLVTQTPAAFYLFLGILVGLTLYPEVAGTGVVMFRHPMPVVLVSTALLIIALATLRLTVPRGTAVWWRLLMVALGAYAVGAFALGVGRGMSLAELLRGHSEWQRMPYWLQGAYLGAVALVPLAFAREVIVSMKVLTLRGHLRWMVVFALGASILFSAM